MYTTSFNFLITVYEPFLKTGHYFVQGTLPMLYCAFITSLEFHNCFFTKPAEPFSYPGKVLLVPRWLPLIKYLSSYSLLGRQFAAGFLVSIYGIPFDLNFRQTVFKFYTISAIFSTWSPGQCISVFAMITRPMVSSVVKLLLVGSLKV